MLRREKKAANFAGANVSGAAGSSTASRRPLKYVKPPTDNATTSTLIVRVPVLVVGRCDYDMYRDAIDRLKDTGLSRFVKRMRYSSSFFSV